MKGEICHDQLRFIYLFDILSFDYKIYTEDLYWRVRVIKI